MSALAPRARVAHVPRTASKQRLRLWLRLLRAARAIEGTLRERLRQTFSMTLPQFDVLAALARTGSGMTMTELSRLLMVSNGNVTGLIDRLHDRGVPVVVITGYAVLPVTPKNVVTILQKPVSKDLLLATIRSFTARRPAS